MNITLEKLAKGQKAAAPARKSKKGDGAPGDFVLQIGADGSCTIFGADTAGNKFDISDVATLTITSSDDTIATAGAPVGMTFNEKPVALGSCVFTITATWTDGSVKPITITDSVTVDHGPATSLILVHNPPVIV